MSLVCLETLRCTYIVVCTNVLRLRDAVSREGINCKTRYLSKYS
jgi:hypothetical protein